MEPDSGNAAFYPPLKPLKPMECLQRRSGIGGELAAFPCTTLMAVGSCCSHRPANTLITSMNVSFNRHANHAEGVQYAITSFVKGRERSSRKQKTAFWCLRRLSSRFLAALCLHRPFLPGGAVALGVTRSPTSSKRRNAASHV